MKIEWSHSGGVSELNPSLAPFELNPSLLSLGFSTDGSSNCGLGHLLFLSLQSKSVLESKKSIFSHTQFQNSIMGLNTHRGIFCPFSGSPLKV